MNFTTTSDAFWYGFRAAFGAPLWVLFAGMIGFGAMGQGSGLGAAFTGLTSLLMFALPGQVVMVEMIASGSPYVAIALAAILTSSRFITMTVTLFPQMDNSDRSNKLFAYVHLLAMTAWAVSMRDFPKMQARYRFAYFAGLGLPCWLIAMPATLVGYALAGSVPSFVTLALVFINPLFFLLTFTEVKPPANRLAIVLGCVLGPVFYALDPDTSLLLAGVVGGTAAYLISRSMRKQAT